MSLHRPPRPNTSVYNLFQVVRTMTSYRTWFQCCLLIDIIHNFRWLSEIQSQNQDRVDFTLCVFFFLLWKITKCPYLFEMHPSTRVKEPIQMIMLSWENRDLLQTDTDFRRPSKTHIRVSQDCKKNILIRAVMDPTNNLHIITICPVVFCHRPTIEIWTEDINHTAPSRLQ